MANGVADIPGTHATRNIIPGEKGLFEALLDFSFRESVGKRYATFLYALHMFLGLVAAIALVVNGFEAAPAQGLLALFVAVPALFLWVLYVRIALEIMLSVFGMAESLSRVTQNEGRQ
jgi:hypothetical protein